MGHLDAMVADMRLRGLRPATIKNYRYEVGAVQRHFGDRSLASLTREELREYLLGLKAKGLSAGGIRLRVFALRFFYRETLGLLELAAQIPIPRRSRHTPMAMTREEVARLLAVTRRPRYRAMFMLMYGAGLRVGEACRLKTTDIDSDRMLLTIDPSKGGGARFAMLSPRLLQELRAYWRKLRPTPPYLFPGRTNPQVPVGRGAAYVAFKKALAEAGVNSRYTPRSLRHSFATHLLEGGVDLRVIQTVLGHRSVLSTEVYTHVSDKLICETTSPLDSLVA